MSLLLWPRWVSWTTGDPHFGFVLAWMGIRSRLMWTVLLFLHVKHALHDIYLHWHHYDSTQLYGDPQLIYRIQWYLIFQQIMAQESISIFHCRAWPCWHKSCCHVSHVFFSFGCHSSNLGRYLSTCSWRFHLSYDTRLCGSDTKMMHGKWLQWVCNCSVSTSKQSHSP